jgi:hypothetical protein
LEQVGVICRIARRRGTCTSDEPTGTQVEGSASVKLGILIPLAILEAHAIRRCLALIVAMLPTHILRELLRLVAIMTAAALCVVEGHDQVLRSSATEEFNTSADLFMVVCREQSEHSGIDWRIELILCYRVPVLITFELIIKHGPRVTVWRESQPVSCDPLCARVSTTLCLDLLDKLWLPEIPLNPWVSV